MRVLILDSFPSELIQELQNNSIEVVYKPGILSDVIIPIISNFSLLICNLERITPEILSAAKRLKMVINIGYKKCKFDLKEISRRGIIICRTGSSYENSYSELALGHILACDRCIVQNTDHLRRGEWRQKFFMKRGGLFGRSIGLVGTDYGCKHLVKIMNDIGMNVNVWESNLKKREMITEKVEYVDDILELARRCDVISIHLDNFSGNNRHLIGQKFFNELKEETIFVNVACAEVVDTEEMMKAIEEKDILIGIDVYDDEPLVTVGDFQNTELVDLATSATSHIGPFTKQSSLLSSKEATKIALTYIKTGRVINQINAKNDELCVY